MTRELWIDFQQGQQIFFPQSFQIGFGIKQPGWEDDYSQLVPKLRISGAITLLLQYGMCSTNVTLTPIFSLFAAFHYLAQWERSG
jgi:hypothetical protein